MRGAGKSPAISLPASCAFGPLILTTEIAAGGRPLDSAKIVPADTPPQVNKGAMCGATCPAPS